MKTKLSLEVVIGLHAALCACDGYQKSVEIDGRAVIVTEPYKLGKTRNKILRNLMELEPHFLPFDNARMKVVKELAGDADNVPLEKRGELSERLGALVKGKSCEVNLDPISQDDLALDRNPIPHGAAKFIIQNLSPDRLKKPVVAAE